MAWRTLLWGKINNRMQVCFIHSVQLRRSENPYEVGLIGWAGAIPSLGTTAHGPQQAQADIHNSHTSSRLDKSRGTRGTTMG